MTEKESVKNRVKFEKIEFLGEGVLPVWLQERFTQYPVSAPGQWSEDQFSFRLQWSGGYYGHIDPLTRRVVRERHRGSGVPWNWKKATGDRRERLLALKELPLPERKEARKKIMPFPGVVMTFEGVDARGDNVIINTRVGNYAEIHPEFGISSSTFVSHFPGHEEALRRAAQGMGVQIITETTDGYHILGQRAAGVMGAGFIGTLGITPGISDAQMNSFVEKAKGTRNLNISGSWLTDSIKEDISEPSELNLEASGLQDSAFGSISLIGAISEPKDGWMHLVIFCKLNLTSNEVESLWANKPGQEYRNLIFVKNNPVSLTALLSRNVYPANFGGYHAYFRQFHPNFLKP